MPSLIKVQGEFNAIDKALDEAGAPPASSRAERIRLLGKFWQDFCNPTKVVEEEAKPQPAEFEQ